MSFFKKFIKSGAATSNEEVESADSGKPSAEAPQSSENQPYDESMDVPDDGEDVATPRQADGDNNRRTKPPPPVEDAESEEGVGDDQDAEGDASEDEEYQPAAPAQGAYNPEDYRNLPVTTDIKDLFQFIVAFTPQQIELETILMPFVPDYIPAVGDIDAFIKIPRPDDIEDNLGLSALDEPSTKQSDSTILGLQLRTVSKEGVPQDTVVKRLKRADKGSKEIDQWIKSISELHRSKPATNVHYTKPMPDIDTLMQEWPPEVEDMLKDIDLPSADVEMPLENYVDIICALLDIPVYKSRVQALHVLFTLYSEFKNSQHFRALADENRLENNRGGYEADRLEL